MENATTAAEAFGILEAFFVRPSAVRINDLSEAITSLKMEEGESAAAYFRRGHDLINRLEEVGEGVWRTKLPSLFLRGLDRRFSSLRDIILNSMPMGGALDLEELKEKILTTEARMQREATVASRESGMVSYDRGGRGGGRGGGGGRGSVGSGGRGSGGRPCSGCGKYLHTEEHCWVLHPELRKEWQLRKEAERKAAKEEEGKGEVSLLMSETAMLSSLPWAPPPSGQVMFIVDNAATSHSVNDLRLFSDLRPAPANVLGLYGDGVVRQRGTVVLQLGRKKVTLLNVLHTPGARTNLLSLGKVQEAGGRYWSEGENKLIMRIGGVYLVSQREEGEVFTLNFEENRVEGAATLRVGAPPLTAETWHARLGHLAPKHIAKMVSSGAVTGIGVSSRDFEALAQQQCEPCLQGKHHRSTLSPWPSDEPPVVARGDLIHTDVWGPYSVPDLENHRYYVSLLDDFSGFSKLILLKTKEQAGAAIREEITSWERQYGVIVKRVQSDNGKEYVNAELKAFFDSKGIRYQLSAPYCPEQNGKAERLNRTVLERTRSMLFGAGLEEKKQLWGEAVKAVGYINNRVTREGQEKTPWELFTGVKPDLSHIRVFGCQAWVYQPKERREGGKLGARSKVGIHLGVDDHSKAWRVLVQGRVMVSKDVKFVEEDRPEEEEEKLKKLSLEEELPLLPSDEEEEESVIAGHGEGENGEAEEEGDQEGVPNAPSLLASPPSLVLRASARIAARRAQIGAITVEEDPAVPTSYEEAMRDPAWKEAMEEELMSHYEYHTWDLVELPQGKKVLGARWVFTVKRGADGTILRRKARLVAKGFLQREGWDFFETSAPTSSKATLRGLCSMAAERDMEIWQLDIKTAFLNGELEEEIYIHQPPGFEEGERVCRLLKALYGLRQAPRQWAAKLKEELEGLG